MYSDHHKMVGMNAEKVRILVCIYWEVGEDSIVKKFIICMLHQILLG
jgi:hypothetical protein